MTRVDIDANIVHTEIVKHVSRTGQILCWVVLTAKNGLLVVECFLSDFVRYFF